jgi:hypothetical protein
VTVAATNANICFAMAEIDEPSALGGVASAPNRWNLANNIEVQGDQIVG